MTCDFLPYDRVCEIIRNTARNWAFPLSGDEPTTTGLGLVRVYQQFGHALWRALEEAHLVARSATDPESLRKRAMQTLMAMGDLHDDLENLGEGVDKCNQV